MIIGAVLFLILFINLVSASTTIIFYGNNSEIGFIKNSSISNYTISNYSDLILGCNGTCSNWTSRGFSFFNVDSIEPNVVVKSASLILNISYTNIGSDSQMIYDVDESAWLSASNLSKYIDLGNGNSYSLDTSWGQTSGSHSIIFNDQAKNDIADSINNRRKFALGVKNNNENSNSAYINIVKNSVILNISYGIPPLTTASGNYSDNEKPYNIGSIGNRSVSITLNCLFKGDSTSCVNTTYCKDILNTCTPSTLYSTPVSISDDGISYIRFRSTDNQAYLENIESEVINLDLNQPIPSPIVWPQCNPADSCCDNNGYFRANGFVCKNAHDTVCNSAATCSGSAHEDRCTGTSSSCPDNNYDITYNDVCNDLVCGSQSCSGSTFQPERTCSAGVCQTNNAYSCSNNLICQDSLNCKKEALLSSDCKVGYLFDGNLSVCYKSNNYTYDLRYDANGNLISIFGNEIGLGWQYTYNNFNQLFQIKDEGINVLTENYYDASGNRIKKVTYDGVGNQSIFYFDNFIQIVNDSGTFNETYYYFNGLLVGKKDNNGKLYFYHANNLGSTSLLTNSSGDVVDDLTYEPFGKNNQSNQRYTYTGHENEDALLYLGARYYNPELGRFLQADPVIGNLYNSQDLNKYSYVKNNPYKYTDPNGTSIIDYFNNIKTALTWNPIQFISNKINEIKSFLNVQPSVKIAKNVYEESGRIPVVGETKDILEEGYSEVSYQAKPNFIKESDIGKSEKNILNQKRENAFWAGVSLGIGFAPEKGSVLKIVSSSSNYYSIIFNSNPYKDVAHEVRDTVDQTREICINPNNQIKENIVEENNIIRLN